METLLDVIFLQLYQSQKALAQLCRYHKALALVHIYWNILFIFLFGIKIESQESNTLGFKKIYTSTMCIKLLYNSYHEILIIVHVCFHATWFYLDLLSLFFFP